VEGDLHSPPSASEKAFIKTAGAIARILLLVGVLLKGTAAHAQKVTALPPLESAVFAVSSGTSQLWYFNREEPPVYDTSMIIAAVGPSGNYEWTPGANASAIRLIPVQGNGQIIVGTLAASAAPNDTSASLKYNGADVGAFKFTIYTPQTASFLDADDQAVTSFGIVVGYQSIGTFEVRDQFANLLPSPFFSNETFDLPLQPDVDNNWSLGETGPSDIARVNIVDRWKQTGLAADPVPQQPGTTMNPPQPLSNFKVFHVPQHYFVGSQTAGAGTEVDVHMLQYFIDHARPLDE
jgi:hypothetical protein